ncbi:unnamed protein product [Adineta steineri]|uniref:NAD(P)(+)--arginine ADP-ribosyltransferase n=2 Tax=Adineta steineri TaxID=433720 RepID=A0A813PT72_9BILA|nr:unnamed protein product [Adineta steineri]CAF3483931.1 unnamed protein product [Adineta steineri]
MSESKSNKNAAASSKSTTSSNIRQPRQRMAQNYLVIWVDANIDETNRDCQDTLIQLKNVVNDINLCTQSDQCIQILNQVDHERVFVITPGSFGEHLVPEIHDMPKLDAVYILCANKSRHEGWTQNWTKIKGVHTNIKEICQVLKLAVKQCDRDSIAVSFLTANELASTENLNQLEPNFMYTQLFKEILLDNKYGDKAMKDLAAYCREFFSGDPAELKNIDEFQYHYRPQQAIRWYTRKCFIWPMLNQALRVMDADIIIKMGFFLRDVHTQIQQLYEQQISNYDGKSFVVYRGQGFMKSDFEKLQQTKGGLMSFNNFLSTSKNKEVSLGFARRASSNPNMVRILFIMSINPCVKSAPFASIKQESFYTKQEEILFSMHTVFRVGAVKQINSKTQLYHVELELTSDDDQQLRLLTDLIREEADDHTAWQRLGALLLKIGQFKKAEELYNALLEQTSDHDEKALYYVSLGYAYNKQGDYEKAIRYYEEGLEISQKTLPSNHPDLVILYNNIGNVYDNMAEYPKALSFYAKALDITQKTLPSNHPDLATSYNNIGSVYDKMGEYSKALSSHEKTGPLHHLLLANSYSNMGDMYDKIGQYSTAILFHEKALDIRQKLLPSNHPHLAASYNSIGNAYDSMGEYSKALSFYEKALEIDQKTLPSDHPDLATSYNNLGYVYDKMGEYSKALSFHEKALDIRKQILPSNHPDLASSYNNIGSVYDKMGEYSKTLSYLEKALEICQKTLPSTHLLLATLYNNIGSVYDKMGEYSKALSSHAKTLEIYQKTLPPDHPSLASSYCCIGSVYYNMGEYSKVFSFFEKALDIRQKTLPSNHPDLASLYNNIGSVYDKMGEYSKALSFYERTLEIGQKTLPSNHPHLAISYNNIAKVYYSMKDYSRTVSYFERALDIFQRALPSTHPHIKMVKESIEIAKEDMIKNS